ncbi:hypothetical protein PHO31112_03380 [Pandoraea horticolens]|uniref:Uncharacterized protein n=1 Tax=Pandoraea horticolens TaxID=2508298 RepID=A0A5E4WQC9_9BURK|nr:hypothetical protein PHO31112_03380 [Pandoraea horticolens]
MTHDFCCMSSDNILWKVLPNAFAGLPVFAERTEIY